MDDAKISASPPIDEQETDTEADKAFSRHLTRMALRDVTQPASARTATAWAQPATASHHSPFRASLDLLLNYFKIARRGL